MLAADGPRVSRDQIVRELSMESGAALAGWALSCVGSALADTPDCDDEAQEAFTAAQDCLAGEVDPVTCALLGAEARHLGEAYPEGSPGHHSCLAAAGVAEMIGDRLIDATHALEIADHCLAVFIDAYRDAEEDRQDLEAASELARLRGKSVPFVRSRPSGLAG